VVVTGCLPGAGPPDAFLPGLAASLNNQSLRLGDLGRREEALAAIEEAVTIRRELAARMTVFASPLRSSLLVLAKLLDAMGQPDDAESARVEAASLS
jgi:tetratricopeptide (TPR) repeat protein